MNRGSQDCGKAWRRHSSQRISICKGPEAGVGLTSLLYLDYQVWLELVSKVKVGVEGREVTGQLLRALEAIGTLWSREM